MLNYFFRSKESGAALPSVIIAMISSVVIISTLSNILDDREIETTRTSIKLFQRLVHKKVLSSASNPINIYQSLTRNSSARRNFLNCIEVRNKVFNERDPIDCVASGNYQLFDARMFYDGNRNSKQVSGNAVAYNIRGVWCGPGDLENCPFTVRTAFKINCPNNLRRCNVAETISVRAEVSWNRNRYNNKRINPGNRLSIASFPKQTKSVRDSGRRFPRTPTLIDNSVFPSDISEAKFQQCPMFADAIGYDNKGIIRCRCAPGFRTIRAPGVKLACESDLPRDKLQTDSVERRSINSGSYTVNLNRYPGNRGNIQCYNSKYHKLVSITGLKSKCSASNENSRDNPGIRCSHGRITYVCRKFKDEHRWAR